MEGKYDLRYLVHYTQASEIPGRIEYLYDIFHIYFIMQNQIGDYIPLVPIGHLDFNALFISGHANYVISGTIYRACSRNNHCCNNMPSSTFSKI